MQSLAEALPEQQARVRKVLGHYKEIGEVGRFGSIMIENSLLMTDKSILSGDVGAMIEAYQDLKDIK
jgi:hypothetical protein